MSNNQSHEEQGFVYCKILTDKKDKIIDVEFIEANPAFEKHTGINPTSIINKKVSQLFPGLVSSTNDWITKYVVPILEGKRFSFEDYVESLRRWFKVDVNPTGNNSFIALFADITKQKEAEVLVKGSVEERYHNFVRNSTEPVFVIDRKGNYLDGSASALQFLECTRVELLTKNIRDTFLFENGKENLFGQGLQEDQLGTIDAEFRANGNSKFIELTFSPAIWEGKPAIFSLGRDVTKIKETKQTSNQSETMFKKLVENSNEVIILTRPDGTVEYLSPSCKEIFGYEPKELVNNVLEIFHPDDSEKAQSALASAYLGKSGMYLEYRIITKDQQVRWVNHSWTPILEDGDLKMIVSNIADITDRKQAIDNLMESEEKYRGLVEKINVGIYRSTTDPSGKILEANPAFARLFGYSSPEELKKLSLTDLYQNPEERKLFLVNLNTYGFAKNEHLRLKKKDGTPIIASVTGRIHQNINGKIEWFDGIVEDITDRKKAEEALIASEENHRSLVENISLGIYRSVPDGGGKYVEVNSAMVKMMGYNTRDEMIKNVPPLSIYQNEQDRKNLLEMYQKNDTVNAVELKLKKKDGTVITASITARAHKDINGKIDGIDGIIEDITERKKVENTLKESEEKYRNLVERANDGIVIIKDGIVKYANPRIIELWGGKLEEVINMPFTNYISSDELPKTLERYKKRLAGETVPSIYKTVLKRKDGSDFPAELNANLITLQGEPADFVIVRDLTGRKRAENILKENEEKYRGLVENIRLGIYRSTADDPGRFIEANPAMCKIFGYDCRTEIVKNAPVSDVYLNPKDRKIFLSKIQKDGFVKAEEVRLKKRDGTPFIASITAHAHKSEDGKIQWIDGVIEDITDRKKSDQALHESEKKYRSLVDNVNIGVWRITADPVGKVIEANPTCLRIFGYDSTEEFKQIALINLHVYPERRKVLLEKGQIARYVKAEEVEFKRKDGSIFTASITGIPHFDSEGKNDWIDGVVEDITERKLIDNTLKSLSLRYEAILKAIPNIIVEVDTNRIFTWVNKAGYDFYGADVIGKEASYYFEGEQETYKVVQPLFDGDENVIYVESWQKRKDGEKRLLAWWCRVLKDAQGNVTGALSSASDITEQKKVEEELKDSEERFRALFELAPDAYYIHDAKGNIIDGNKAAEKLVGQKREDLIGKNVLNIGTMPKSQIPKAIALFAKNALGFGTGPDEFTVIRKDGSKVEVEDLTVPIKIKGKTLILAVERDITKRKETMQALYESEEKYRNLIERANDGIVVICDGIIQYANQRVAEMWKGKIDEIIGSPVRNFIHPDELPKVAERYKKRIAGETSPPIYKTVLKRKDGSTFPAELNASVIIQRDKPADFVFIRDLSGQKKTEDELKNSDDKFKIIFENTPDAYYLCDLKGNFIDGNKASENLLGYKREELKGKNLLELGLLPTIQFPKALTILAKNALGLNTGPDVFTITRKDGSKIEVELTTMTVQLQNETAVLAIGREATKNKRSVSGIRKKDEIYHITAKHTK